MVTLGNMAVDKKYCTGEMEDGVVRTGDRVQMIAAVDEMPAGRKRLLSS